MSDDDEGRQGKVVLYVTSVQAVRETHELCKQAVHILKSRRVVFLQKDVFLHPDYGRELSERMEREEEDERIALPQVWQDYYSPKCILPSFLYSTQGYMSKSA